MGASNDRVCRWQQVDWTDVTPNHALHRTVTGVLRPPAPAAEREPLALMKRITGSSLGRHLDSVRLSRGDLEHIDSLMRKVSSSVSYTYADFEFDGIEDLASRSPGVIQTLEVCSDEPRISLSFDRQSVWVRTSSKDLAARGVYAEL